MWYTYEMHVPAIEYHAASERNLTHARTCIDESEDIMLSEISQPQKTCSV